MSGLGLIVLVVALGGSLAVSLLVRPRGQATTFDFYLAGQKIGVLTNSCAICGDYVSAASFLGVAAAVYASGLDGIWYATGFAAGFVPVLLFVAAPLRRFGEFSIPDFLGRRLESERVRLTAVIVAELVILSYLVPQAVGSGLTWALLIDQGLVGLSPYTTGVIISMIAIPGVVVVGGMRGTTWTQAVQFLVLLAGLVWLTATVVGDGFDYPVSVGELGAAPLRNPVQVEDGWEIRDTPNLLHPEEPTSFSQPGSRYGPLGQFALVVTLILGTAGLPHVMNRFFTSPSGKAARMTTVWVLALVGVFYALAVLLGTAARALIPAAVAQHQWLEALTVDGVLRIPEHALLALGRLRGGTTGLGVVAAGAFLAILDTIAGLLLACAASWGHDVYERYINPGATQRQALLAGQAAVAVVAVGATALALGLNPEQLPSTFPSIVAQMVTWAFALAGSALTPVFILTIWWPRTTAAGAVAGMAIGAASAVALIAAGLSLGGGQAAVDGLLITPTLLAAPASLLTTITVSLRTAPPVHVDASWMRMHGTAADRHAERLARLTIEGIAGTPAKRRFLVHPAQRPPRP